MFNDMTSNDLCVYPVSFKFDIYDPGYRITRKELRKLSKNERRNYKGGWITPYNYHNLGKEGCVRDCVRKLRSNEIERRDLYWNHKYVFKTWAVHVKIDTPSINGYTNHISNTLNPFIEEHSNSGLWHVFCDYLYQILDDIQPVLEKIETPSPHKFNSIHCMAAFEYSEHVYYSYWEPPDYDVDIYYHGLINDIDFPNKKKLINSLRMQKEHNDEMERLSLEYQQEAF